MPTRSIPEGAERVYRLYHPQRDDYAVFPESELATKLAQGYVSQPQQSEWIGYAYPNVDTDGDGLIDAWENLLGTKPLVADTDCDGTSDGEEVMVYNRTEHRYEDPLDGPCIRFFADDFASGDTTRWSTVVGGL